MPGGGQTDQVVADADAAGTRIAPMASTSAHASLGEVRFIVNLRLRVQHRPSAKSGTTGGAYVEVAWGFAGQRDATVDPPYAQGDSERNSADGQTFRTPRGLSHLMGET